MNHAIPVLLVCLVFGACTPGIGTGQYSTTIYPRDLQVEVNDRQMALVWKKHGEGVIAGYNVYISREPLTTEFPGPIVGPSIEPFNEVPFPGDTKPEDGIERFVAEGLDNGVRYYVSVRVVFPDQSVSKPSEEIDAVCGPRGEIKLGIRYQSQHDGYSLERNGYVRADASDNDLYFFSKEGVDYLGSPKRLNGFLNDNHFLILPYSGEFAHVSARLMESELTATEDLVEIALGDWILLQRADGRNALMKVLSVDDLGQKRSVMLFFAYSTLMGEIFF